jgi:hypothetical protein
MHAIFIRPQEAACSSSRLKILTTSDHLSFVRWTATPLFARHALQPAFLVAA